MSARLAAQVPRSAGAQVPVPRLLRLGPWANRVNKVTGKMNVNIPGNGMFALAAFTGPGPVASFATAAATSPVVRSGFRQFSQKATRLQGQLKKTFSFRTIFSDVFTNNPSDGSSGTTEQKGGSQSSQSHSNTDAANVNAMDGSVHSSSSSSTRKRKSKIRGSTSQLQSKQDSRHITSNQPLPMPPAPIHQLEQRHPPIKLKSAVTTIVTGTIAESISGFVGGYVLGATTDVTRRTYQAVKRTFFLESPSPATKAAVLGASYSMLPYSSLTKFSQKSLQSHARSMAWGTEWAKMGAVFCFCRLVIQSVRQQQQQQQQTTRSDTSREQAMSVQDDGWNAVAGCGLAGSILPIMTPVSAAAKAKASSSRFILAGSVTRGALLYSGTMFLLHPELWKQGMEALWLTLPAVTVKGRKTFFKKNFKHDHEDDKAWYDRIGLML